MKFNLRYASVGALFLSTIFAGIGGCSSDDDKTPGGGEDGNPKAGTVGVTNTKLSVSGLEISSYTAAASFVDATGVGGTKPVCEKSTEGACQIQVCTLLAGDGGTLADAGSAKSVHAGKIDISGGAISPTISLTPESDSSEYDGKSGEKSIWAGGEDIKIQAEGNSTGVGAFTATLKAPSLITLTAPEWTTALTIDRAKALELTWSAEGTASGKVQVLIAAAAADNKQASIICEFSASEKKGTIAAAALAKVPAGSGTFLVQSSEQAKQDVSGYALTLSLSSTAAREGGAAVAQATFE